MRQKVNIYVLDMYKMESGDCNKSDDVGGPSFGCRIRCPIIYGQPRVESAGEISGQAELQAHLEVNGADRLLGKLKQS